MILKYIFDMIKQTTTTRNPSWQQNRRSYDTSKDHPHYERGIIGTESYKDSRGRTHYNLADLTLSYKIMQIKGSL